MKKVIRESSVRDFIRNALSTLRKDVPTLTLETFADRLKIGRSSLKMIVSGKRRATPQQVLGIGRALRLSTAEVHYLQLLSLSEGAEESWEKAHYAALLKKSRTELKSASKISSAKTLLDSSLIQAVLVLLMDTQKPLEEETLHWIAEKLAVDSKAVGRAIETLEKTGLLQNQSDGNLHIRMDRLTNKSAQKEFIKNSLLQSAQRVEKDYDNEQTLFMNYTFSTTEDSLANLQRELKTVMEKYLAESAEPKQMQIANAAFQVFPFQTTNQHRSHSQKA